MPIWNKPTERQIPVWWHSCEACVGFKFIETESRIVPRGQKRRNSCFVVMEFQFCKVEKVWRSVSQQHVYAYTEPLYLKMLSRWSILCCMHFLQFEKSRGGGKELTFEVKFTTWRIFSEVFSGLSFRIKHLYLHIVQKKTRIRWLPFFSFTFFTTFSQRFLRLLPVLR